MATVGQQFIFWRWTNDGRRSIQEMAERILVWLPQYPRKNHQRIYLNVRSPYHSDYRQGGHILHRLHQNPETLWWTFGKRLFRQNYPQHTSGPFKSFVMVFQKRFSWIAHSFEPACYISQACQKTLHTECTHNFRIHKTCRCSFGTLQICDTVHGSYGHKIQRTFHFERKHWLWTRICPYQFVCSKNLYGLQGKNYSAHRAGLS